MQTAVKYHSEIKTVPLGGRMITIENLTPILPPKEQARRKRELKNSSLMCSVSTPTSGANSGIISRQHCD